jgi:hypothetical protein
MKARRAPNLLAAMRDGLIGRFKKRPIDTRLERRKFTRKTYASLRLLTGEELKDVLDYSCAAFGLRASWDYSSYTLVNCNR